MLKIFYLFVSLFLPEGSIKTNSSSIEHIEEADAPVVIKLSRAVVNIGGNPTNGAQVSLTDNRLYKYSSEPISNGNWEMDSVRKLSYELSPEIATYQYVMFDKIPSDNYCWHGIVLVL